jgi:GNAT superfamily N-acetyltransferase
VCRCGGLLAEEGRGAAGHLLGRNVLGLTSARLVRTLSAAVDCFRRPMRTGRAGRVPRVDQQGDGSGPVIISRVAEAEIPANLAVQVQALLQVCCPGYPSRAYFKLPPHFRYLAMAGGELAGQAGVELRVIRVGSTVLRTFGVVDLCVRGSGRSRGLAGRLLAEVTELARSCGMDFVVLFADDDRLYTRNGWTRAANPCSWLKINDHTTLGLATAEDTGALMVKKIGQRTWPAGEVDLLGHLF